MLQRFDAKAETNDSLTTECAHAALSENASVSPWPKPRSWLRLVCAACWMVATLAVASFAVLKPTTTSADLKVLPHGWTTWLDANYDVRTLIMTLIVSVPTSLLLVSREHNSLRRKVLVLITGVLVLFEFLQLCLPQRGFGFPDIGYTLAGGFLAECLAVCTQLSLLRSSEIAR